MLSLAPLWADPPAPALLTVTDTVARPRDKVPPLGANNWGGCGAVEWAANNFFRNSGNEPVYWRNLHRARRVGPGWFEIDGPGTTWWDLWNSGFLSGADLRIYRLVDAAGQPLAQNRDSSNLDLTKGDHFVFVGKGQVLPEGSPGFPDGGWVGNTWGDVYPNSWIRSGNLAATDATVEPGRTYWYSVVAVSGDNQESDRAGEVSVTTAAAADDGPHLLVASGDDKAPDVRPGQNVEFRPKVAGGRAPLTFAAPEGLPAGLKIDAASGLVSGKPTAAVANYALKIQVTDAAGRSDTRAWLLGAPAAESKGKPQPPSGLAVAAGKGCVTVRWQPSATPGVVAYRLKRSTAPTAQQQQRVYVTADTPELKPWDYVALSRRFDPFDMKYVHPRVRGIGNPADSPGWYWHADLSQIKFALAPHPQPLPAEMDDPGQTCLQVTAAAGPQTISQITMIGTEHGGESLWYGLFEPGCNYRFEGWLRQEGLGDGGKVTFGFGKGYPAIHTDFVVTEAWQRFTFDLVGPPRPRDPWHFGPTFGFTGPGRLWLDNLRLFRVDRPEDAAKPYTPNRTVLDELLASQPAIGPKGVHRTWYLDKDATMDSILSWHANSKVSPDWYTSLEGTLTMTLPMGLSFDAATGDGPHNRMRPWLVMQHILHSEDDWRHLIEYLAAPYDPARDTPQSKPYAFRRAKQRGNNTPWTDEFSQITIEFGNETWHNGHFPDWLGFSTRGAIHQGGREYGLFCQYLIDQIKQSPYWAAQHLDSKIRFALGANYDTHINGERVTGYGEEAMQACPGATVLGHANYVGPKWETGDYSARHYDDHGVEECLLSFLTGPEKSQKVMGAACELLSKSNHPYDIAAYEGGPGGFALPGSAPPEQVETNEKYGKSLAQAVGAFDAWMRSYLYGWTDQCYLAYSQGNHWASHQPFHLGFRPSPAWQALALRNRAAGDLLTVEETAVPTIARGKASYPVIGAYALRDGRTWSIFVVSRRLDGPIPTRLKLPFATARKVTLQALTGDPRLTNREQLNFSIVSRDLPAASVAGGLLEVEPASGGMPAGSILLYVIET
jgi:hypothetical protein